MGCKIWGKYVIIFLNIMITIIIEIVNNQILNLTQFCCENTTNLMLNWEKKQIISNIISLNKLNTELNTRGTNKKSISAVFYGYYYYFFLNRPCRLMFELFHCFMILFCCFMCSLWHFVPVKHLVILFYERCEIKFI